MSIREKILELANKHRKPAHKIKVGDVVLMDISGHCGARNVNYVWLLDRRCLGQIHQLVQQYRDWAYEHDNDVCEHCGLPATLQWQRFMVVEISATDIEQAKEWGTDIDDLYRELYTV